MVELALTSTAFPDGSGIPQRFAGTSVPGGRNASPPIRWTGAPAGAQSFALVMVDRHPVADNWVHWMVVDLPANATALPENASGALMPPGTRELGNTYGEQGYGGPAPPKGSGSHMYEITVYALNAASLTLPDGASLETFENAIRDVTIARGTLTGTFAQ